MNLPLVKCRKCHCGFQGVAGCDVVELCNGCAVDAGMAALERLTAATPPSEEGDWTGLVHYLPATLSMCERTAEQVQAWRRLVERFVPRKKE